MIEEQVEDSLPKGWKKVKLGEILSVSSGKGIKVNSLQGGPYPVYGGNGLNGYHSEYFLEEPKLIIGRVGVKCGVTHITNPKAWVTDNALIVEPKQELFDLKFLKLKLEFENLNKLSVSTAQPVISGSKIYAYEVVLPPIEEQRQIVAKIEELFSDLDKGIEELKTAQQQLKVYRQAVLKWAFEGKLTNENVKEGALPEGWKWVELGKACVIKRGKSKHRPRNESSLFGGKYPFIQTGDIRNANGGYISTYTQTYSELGLQQSKLWPKGTLCITIAANIGETAILNFDACFPDSVVGLICNEDVLLNKYTNYFFISYKSKLEEKAPATAQKNINVDILEKVEMPICSIEEQQQIVQELESRFSVFNKIEETITNGLKQAELLKKCILNDSFGGSINFNK